MAKVTDEYVRGSFFRQFARKSHHERQGIIEGLIAIDAVMMERDGEPAPLLEEAENGSGS